MKWNTTDRVAIAAVILWGLLWFAVFTASVVVKRAEAAERLSRIEAKQK